MVFLRALVIALILATALTMAWPLPDLSDIAQGVLITTALMTPICVYIVISKLWPQPSNRQNIVSTRNAPAEAPDLRPAPAPLMAVEKMERELEVPLDVSLGEPLENQHEENLQTALHDSERNSATSLHSQSSAKESPLDQTLSVGEQLETLDDLVDFHDIGDDQYQTETSGPYDPDAPPTYNPLEKAIAVARDAILEEPGIQDYSTENLPAKSRIELSEMVVRLRSDKMKLQKLVIAQKAVIDSEKQAHERTRVVVKDAISVMRHARHGQRIAEKIARRERAERLRLEQDYVKVRRALDNALSTLKSKSEQSEAEKA